VKRPLARKLTFGKGIIMCARNMKLTAAALLTLAFCCPVHGGEETGAIIADWQLYEGTLFFDLSGTHNNSPCSFPERWAINTQTEVGKVHYAAFLAAVMTGKTVQVIGTGTGCAHGNTELVTVFRVYG
jgi:hypothetical protein